MDARRPLVADLGVSLLVVTAPLVLTPFSFSPFGDPKLVVVVAAAAAMWAAGFTMVRPLAWAAAAWVIVTGISAIAGTDPWQGLGAQTTGEGGGLILVLVCVTALLAGAGSSERLRERARRWFVLACAAVGIFGIFVRLAPGTFGTLGRLSFVGATMGNQLFAGALLSAGVVAAMGDREQRLSRQIPVVALLTLATATFGERSAIVLPTLATVIFLARAQIPWRRAGALLACVLGVLGAWQIGAAHLPAGGRGASLTVARQATDGQRFTVWRVLATRAVPERPILGWGPGSSQSAYLANASEPDVRSTSRDWADAHDVLLETLVTSGILGLLALLWLLGRAGARALRGPPEHAWAFAAAACLGAYSLFEPLNLVLTPLLFFFLGTAGRVHASGSGEVEGRPAGPERIERAGRALASIALAAALGMSVLMFTAATFERWGRDYGEEWAYRDALRVQPWRVGAALELATLLAVDGRSHDTRAAAEARGLIADTVRAHPWDVNVRPRAADIDMLLGDPTAGREWIRLQIQRFPGDAAALAAAAGTSQLP